MYKYMNTYIYRYIVTITLFHVCIMFDELHKRNVLVFLGLQNLPFHPRPSCSKSRTQKTSKVSSIDIEYSAL